MGIKNIVIENFKSIKKCSLDFEQLNLLIGENGCGKTNIILAIQYFYDNLIGKKEIEDIYDLNNKFSNKVKIEITYDCNQLSRIINNKLKKAEGQYEIYYRKVSSLIDKNKEIKLQLTKIKDETIQWNIKAREARAIIYNIFPMYFIDTKKINVSSWEFLWEEIGDLIKLEKPISEKIKENFFSLLEESTDVKITNKFEELEKILEKGQIQIQNTTPKQYAATLAKNYFQGEKFKIAEHTPNYFSDGTNSFNYINILIAIVGALRSKKSKLPILFIDEPEISLHHKYIDKLSENILESDSKIQFVIATHSPRLLKNVLRAEQSKKKVINLRCKNNYTTFSEMKLFDDRRQNIFINDEHVNSYFSNMLVLVEGESELELLNNKYLRTIYPVLKNLDVIQASSNDVLLKSLLPDKRNYQTPYLILIDMDKILEMETDKNQIILKKGKYLPNHHKELFYYGEKRINTYHLKRRIDKMAEKCRFHYQLPFFSCEDKNYFEFIQSIKKYYQQYHIFVNSTTLEGMLINSRNYQIFWDFLKTQKSVEAIKEIESYYNYLNENNQINLLRLLVDGKTDYLKNSKELSKIQRCHQYSIQMIQKHKIQKTSGWISKWIEYYLIETLQINESSELKEKTLKKELKDESKLTTVKINFYYQFYEMYQLIKEITDKMSH